jgi:thiol-disulfide isomerase/thioredoxin
MKYSFCLIFLFIFHLNHSIAQYSYGWDTAYNGKSLAEVSGTTKLGKQFTDAKYKGNILIFDFWATWCLPCRQLTHELDSVLNTDRSNDVKLIGVNYREDVAGKIDPDTYWKEHGYTYDMVKDRDNTFGKSVNAENPTVLLVDKDGIIKAKWNAWTPNRALEIKTMIWWIKDHPKVTQQAVLDANKNEEYIKAMFLFDALVKIDSTQKDTLAQEKFKALLHIDEWEAVDYAKEERLKTHDSENTLSYVGNYIAQCKDIVAPKIYLYGAEVFQAIFQKYPDSKNSFIAYDLMARCYFKASEKNKAISASKQSLSIAKSSTQTPQGTIDYLEKILASYQK